MDMKEWLNGLRKAERKKAMPILSFPAVQLMRISVRELISDSDRQAEGMQRIAERVDAAASVSLMDLSVEAECFGSQIRVSDDEVPTVVGSVVNSMEDAQALKVPQVGAGRTGVYVEAISKALKLITDRPVFAGVIGPYSLAGRLYDMSEIMVAIYIEPDVIQALLDFFSVCLIHSLAPLMLDKPIVNRNILNGKCLCNAFFHAFHAYIRTAADSASAPVCQIEYHRRDQSKHRYVKTGDL